MIILHLLSLKLAQKEIRYVVLDQKEGFPIAVPLFLGADLLCDSGILTNNHCRIHARYAKKGLAVKLTFPEDVSVGGVTNCHSGAWFYNIQGVFQLLFEHHHRETQQEIVPALMDLWKTSHACPHLPYSMTVTLERLVFTSKALHHQLHSSNLISSCAETLKFIQGLNAEDPGSSSMEVVCDSQGQELPPEETGINDDVLEEESSSEQDLSITSSVESLVSLCDNLLRLTKDFSTKCSDEERGSANALKAFVKLVQLDVLDRDDEVFGSFLDVLCNLQVLSGDRVRLKMFGNVWNLTDRQNALMCLMCEWLGRKLAHFVDAISEKVVAFKAKNASDVCPHPPSPQTIVEELFPPCMLLLLGHWMGTRATPEEDLAESSEACARPAPEEGTLGNGKPRPASFSQGSRDDHSYSTPPDTLSSPACDGGQGSKEDVGHAQRKSRHGGGDAVLALHSPRDHSYFSTTFSGASHAHQESTTHTQDDHTYVATGNVESSALPQVAVSNRREDHTYVSVKERRAKATVSNPGTRQEPLPKRLKCGAPEKVKDVSLLLDPSRYPFIQLVLEFMNNTLISGVAHVVYTSLLHRF